MEEAKEDSKFTSEPTVEVFLTLEDLNEELEEDPLADNQIVKEEHVEVEEEEEKEDIAVLRLQKKAATSEEEALVKEASCKVDEEWQDEAMETIKDKLFEDAPTLIEEEPIEAKAINQKEEEQEELEENEKETEAVDGVKNKLIDDDEELIDASTLFEQESLCDDASG